MALGVVASGVRPPWKGLKGAGNRGSPKTACGVTARRPPYGQRVSPASQLCLEPGKAAGKGGEAGGASVQLSVGPRRAHPVLVPRGTGVGVRVGVSPVEGVEEGPGRL